MCGCRKPKELPAEPDLSEDVVARLSRFIAAP
jgi:hypothetical protein